MLENVKVGDRVRSCLAGWGTVISFCDEGNYVMVVHDEDTGSQRKLYFRDGKQTKKDLYPEIVEVQKKKKWEPEGGPCFIRGDGSIGIAKKIPNNVPDFYKEEGRAYPTRKLAEKAHKMIQPYQRLVAYILEHAPDWEPDWDYYQSKCYIHYDHQLKEWDWLSSFRQECLSVPMPENVAEELCDKLNNDEVTL